MTFFAAFSLLLVMLALAAIPSASVVLVVSRSATLGVANGIAVAIGIVLGDLVFVVLAILGMSVLAETLGTFFAIIKYAGGGYLIWYGIVLLRSGVTVALQPKDARTSTLLASLFSGFILTLGDVKAILFYASLFPTFVDMVNLTLQSVTVIVLVTIVSVGGVKLVYAFAAQRIEQRFRGYGAQKLARPVAGFLLVGMGAYLIAKT